MVLKLYTDKGRYYQQALRILHAVPPYNQLTETQIKILAYMLYQRDVIEETLSTEAHVVDAVLFSKKSKHDVCDALELKDTVYRNSLSALKKKGFIKNNQLNLSVPLRYKMELTFNFNERGTQDGTSKGSSDSGNAG